MTFVRSTTIPKKKPAPAFAAHLGAGSFLLRADMASIKRPTREGNRDRPGGRRRARVLAVMPTSTTSRIAETIAADVTLSDILAAHLHDAFTRIDVLTNCVDVLAQHCAGALDRIDMLEGQLRPLTEPTDGACSGSEAISAPTPTAKVDVLMPPVTAGRPALTLVSNAADQQRPVAFPSRAQIGNQSDRFSDMTSFLHAVVGARRRSGGP